MRGWWQLSSKELAGELSTDLDRGLSEQEAVARLFSAGFNKLPEKKAHSSFKIFLSQFQSLLIWVLIFAAVVSGFLREWVDAGVIAAILVLNAAVGFIQEYRAERAIQALKKMSAPHCDVIRDGQMRFISAHHLVKGDIVLLEAGDRMPADGRVVHASLFKTQEAALTGESETVTKSTESIGQDKLSLGDRKNMVFMGTIASQGRAKMVVTGTGLETEMGNIAQLLQTADEEKTPLQRQLDRLGNRLVYVFLTVVALVFGLGVLQGNHFIEMLLTSLSLAVAAIPEGLPAIVTISLALGVHKMAKRGALIRKMSAVETLGCATVICSDKTGTLTQNQMTAREIWIDDEKIGITGVGYKPEGGFIRVNGEKKLPEDFLKALEVVCLANTASLSKSNDEWQITGDPTEAALLTAAAKAGCWKEELEAVNPLLFEIPFDSERKRMSMIRQTKRGEVLFIKGAPDVLLGRSSRILKNSQAHVLTPQDKKHIERINHEFASKAYRVIAAAYRELGSAKSFDRDHLEEDLVFAGLFALIDPPRKEAKESIRKCIEAGIRPVMITGDHKETAAAVAKEIGLMGKDDLAINGTELDGLTEQQLEERAGKTAVFSRVSAEHKLKIVRALKKRGEVVAMTGDGVNDAPALKEADIGVAMGLSGTDVAKESADMIVTDDNFASIVNAVEEGRGIYDNILKFVNYLLSTNIAEIVVIVAAMILGIRERGGHVFIPLSAVQILWLNLITDGLPAIGLSLDPISASVMKKKPRPANTAILSSNFVLHVGLMSVLIAAGALAGCFWGLRTGDAAKAQTMTLTVLIMLQLARVQMIRSAYHVPMLSNPALIFSLIFSFGLQLAVVYFPPLQSLLGTASLNLGDWQAAGVLSTAVWGVGTLLTKGINRFLIKS